jgi:hypothetical protein
MKNNRASHKGISSSLNPHQFLALPLEEKSIATEEVYDIAFPLSVQPRDHQLALNKQVKRGDVKERLRVHPLNLFKEKIPSLVVVRRCGGVLSLHGIDSLADNPAKKLFS